MQLAKSYEFSIIYNLLFIFLLKNPFDAYWVCPETSAWPTYFVPIDFLLLKFAAGLGFETWAKLSFEFWFCVLLKVFRPRTCGLWSIESDLSASLVSSCEYIFLSGVICTLWGYDSSSGFGSLVSSTLIFVRGDNYTGVLFIFSFVLASILWAFGSVPLMILYILFSSICIWLWWSRELFMLSFSLNLFTLLLSVPAPRLNISRIFWLYKLFCVVLLLTLILCPYINASPLSWICLSNCSLSCILLFDVWAWWSWVNIL